MPGKPVSPTNQFFWKLWNRLIHAGHSTAFARRPRSIDAFELEERVLLSATPAPTEQSSNTSTSQTSTSNTSTTTSQPSSNSQAVNNSSSSSSQGVSVVLVDTHLRDSGLLIQSVPRDAQLFLYNSQYDSAHDVLSRVSNWAESTGQKISTLSVLGQGADGSFQLGTDWISNSTLESVTSDWLRLAQSLTNESKIDLFGGLINSQSTNGQQLLDQIAQLTGADVFASTNTTGKDGDWRLEASSSNASSQISSQPSPLNDTVLQRYSGTLNSNSAANSSNDVDARSQIVFVDTSIPDLQDLIRNIPADTEIVFIDSLRDGMDQMAQFLTGRHNVSSIAILSHGSDARLFLGTSNVTSESLENQYAADWAVVRDSLAPNAQILLYGCDIAEDNDGRALIDAIALATKASVAASTNLTGSSRFNGDWNLEYSTGSIADEEMRNALATSDWDYLLVTATFQQGSSSYSGATDTMIDAGATTANNGSALTISANLLGTTQDLIKFDLSSIPAGSTITGVQLSFTSSAALGLVPSVNLYKMLTPWNSAANWNSFGGGGVPRDNVTASSTSDASWGALLSLGGTATFSSANMASTVQSWVNTPSSNNGWLMVGGGLATVSFYSSDTGTAANRPLLTVTYTAPTAPTVDLDANNSSGATGNNFNTSFSQHGAAIKVADTDGTVTAGTNSISSNLSGMTLTISNLLDGNAESLSATTTGTSITASYNSTTGVLTLSGSDTAAHYQSVLQSVTYNNTADNISTASRTINVVATDPYGGNSATATATISIIANTPPTITNGASVVLTGTNEDTTSSGTTVNSILSSAGWSDPDAGALKGIAITATAGNGTWQYSTDGTTWSSFGTVSSSNALLLTSTTQVRYVPDGLNGETATFSFKAWDQTSGTASTNSTPSYASASPGGGTTAYSSQSASTSMTVTSVNDAPTITNGSTVTLTGTDESTTSTSTTISSLLTTASWNDVDSGTLKGIAVTGKGGNGTWQYSTDGNTWANFGTVSGTNALLLTSTSQVRYVPDGQNGETATFTFVAWDQSSGTASTNSTPGYANPGSGGGTSAYSSQSATASISITSINNAPTLVNGSVVTLTGTNEDTTSSASSVNSILTSAGWSDVDTSAQNGIAITGMTGNGTWQFSTDGNTWTAFGSVTATNALLLTSGSQVRYVPDGQNSETSTFSFVAWDQTTGTASTNATPRYANPGSGGGTSAFSNQSASTSMTITAVNDAPTITNSATVTLAGTDEDTPSSGTSINSILTTANWADVDTGALKGIAVTSKSGNGTWQYSTDGVTWTSFGSVSATNSLLLTSASQVRYLPDGQNGETANFTFIAWDQTSGSGSVNGTPGYANPGSGGGTSAFSSQSGSASITVSSLNDAPTISNGSNIILTGTNENTTSTATTVNSILSSAGWGDVDTGALKGMAVTGKAENGAWQYSTDGTTWTNFGTVSSSNALLLTSTSQIRYVPDGQNGETATFSFVAWDQTSGTASTNATPRYANPGSGGGTTAYSSQSATASITISSANDAPAITNGATVVLAGTNEDTTSSATTIDSILTSANWADVDLGALKGIAVTGKSGNGAWQYSTDGTTWTSFGTVSSSSALLLASTTQVRYVPDNQNGETATFTFVAWDQTSGTASTNGTARYANPGSGGGTTAYSSQSASASLTITSVNDAPTMNNGTTITLPATNEKTTSSSTTVNTILSTANWNDVDVGALKGIAVTGTTGNGTWQYSTDGTTWATFGSVSTTNALLITSSTQVRYVPDQQNGETATFTFLVWDQTSGTASTNALPSYADATTQGGSTAFSSQSSSASISVTSINDAPTLTNGALVTLTATDEDTISSATTANTILGSAGWTDVDNSALKGIAVTGKTGNGTWQYSTDGTTWANFGSVTSSNALLITSTTQIRYVPDGKNGETATFSFVAWDQTSGTASTYTSASYANAGSGGGSSAYSSQSASASINVTSINDAPTITNGATVVLTGTNEDTTSSAASVNSILTSASIADVDTGALRGMAITGVSGNGTWQYSTDGATWTSLGTVSATNALLLTSSSQLRYVPDGKNGETATFTFSAWDRTTGSASVNGLPSYADTSVRGGITAFSTGSATGSMTITSVNDAPTITNGATVTLAATNEDTTSSAATVASLLTSANWNDADTGALKGIGITGKTGNGTWQYSTDGTTWASFGATSSSNALLLSSSTQVRYIPDNQNGETATFTFVAWDQISGTASTNGTPRFANPGAGGGTTAFSAQLATASLSVTSVNDAPTIVNGANIPLVGTDLLTISSSTSVNTLLTAANWADIDTGALKGIAVTNQTGHGTWQYSTDGVSWKDFGTVSTSNALLLTSTSSIRYVPDGLTIELPKITFAAWDQTTGIASTNATASYGDASTRGGTTAYSSQTASASMIISLLSSQSVTLPSTDEDTPSAGTSANWILMDASWSSINIGLLGGMAITDQTGNGTWQYSTDGVNWSNFGNVSSTHALVISSWTEVRYLPDGQNGETAGFVFQAWNELSGPASSNSVPRYQDSTINLLNFSSQSSTASTTVTSVNDAPTLVNGTISLPGTDEDSTSSATTIDSLLTAAGWGDVDASALKGVAVTGMTGNGTWQYSSDGAQWTNISGISTTNALLLDTLAQVRYVPDGLNGETSTLTFVAWDETLGTSSTSATPHYANALTRGGTSAFSANSTTASMQVGSVNDAPSITNGPIGSIGNTNQFTNSTAVSADSLLTAAAWSDPDTGAQKGIAITGTTGNGTWQYSVDGTNWTNFGSVSPTNALLLTASTLIHYVPDGTNSEMATMNFVAWDQSTGLASASGVPSYDDASTGGGSSAFSSQSASADVTIVAVNRAPTITNSGTATLTGTDEDTPSSPTSIATILTAAGYNDPDGSSAQGIAVTNQTGNGTWQYSTDGSTWTAFGSTTANNSLLLDSNTLIRYVPDNQNGETATFGFVAWDETSGTPSGDGTPTYADTSTTGGTTAFSSQIAGASIVVTSVNDAPTIQNGAVVNLPGSNQNTPTSPTSVDSILTSAGWNDPDLGALKGIAVTSVTGSGTWQYSTDGTNWTDFGTVSPTNSLLLASNAEVRYQPDGIHGETASFQFVAWDQSTGTASSTGTPSYADPQPGGTTNAYSSQMATAQSTIVQSNWAPTITNGATVVLASTDEDTTSASTSIDSILTAANWADANVGAVKGMAVTASSGNGNWQYSADGLTWTNFGTVSNNSALLLGSGTLIRYQPDGMNGEAANFQFVAWDQTSGTASSNTSPSFGDASATGGTTSYSSSSATVTINVTSVNDAPTLNNGTAVTLPTTNEDATSSATTVSSILTSANVHDVDLGAAYGMAITSISANGTWQYSTDGTTWTNFGSLSSAHALLLNSSSQVRYVPDGMNGEIATFSFIAWDQSTGTASTNIAPSFADASITGGTTAYSSSSATASINVTSVNDAPTLNNGATVTLPGTDEDTTSSATTVNSILVSAGVYDADASAAYGMAITSTSANGTWQYSTDGTTWNNFGNVSASHALLLDAASRVRYVPDGMNGEVATFSFVAWDQSSGATSTNVTASYGNTIPAGGVTAYSIQSGTASINVTSVNDRPIITNGAVVDLASTDRLTPSPSTSVDQILTTANWSDPDVGAQKGIAITGQTGLGTWQYSTDGTTWTNFGSVSASQALLVTSSALIRYVPDGVHMENASFTFVAWDQSSGTASTNTTTNYGDTSATTAFSIEAASAAITVNYINKAPSIISTTIALPGTTDNTLSVVTSVDALLLAVNWTDDDPSGLKGIAVTSATGAGSWKYSADGVTWTDFGAVSATHALLLTSHQLIVYAPKATIAEQAAFTFRGWDQSSGVASTSGAASFANPGSGGGTTAFTTAGQTSAVTIGVSSSGVSIINPPTNDSNPNSGSNGNSNNNSGGPTNYDPIRRVNDSSGSSGNSGAGVTPVPPYQGSTSIVDRHWPSTGTSVLPTPSDETGNPANSMFIAGNSNFIPPRYSDSSRAAANPYRGVSVQNIGSEQADGEPTWVPIVHHPVIVARVDGLKGSSKSLLLGSTTTVSSTLTAGYVLWLLHGGSLWGGMVSLIGSWSTVDPLPILENAAAVTDKEKEDRETLESLISQGRVHLKQSRSKS